MTWFSLGLYLGDGSVLPRWQPALQRELHRFADRNVDHAGLAIDPAVGAQTLFLRPPQLVEIGARRFLQPRLGRHRVACRQRILADCRVPFAALEVLKYAPDGQV